MVVSRTRSRPRARRPSSDVRVLDRLQAGGDRRKAPHGERRRRGISVSRGMRHGDDRVETPKADRIGGQARAAIPLGGTRCGPLPCAAGPGSWRWQPRTAARRDRSSRARDTKRARLRATLNRCADRKAGRRQRTPASPQQHRAAHRDTGPCRLCVLSRKARDLGLVAAEQRARDRAQRRRRPTASASRHSRWRPPRAAARCAGRGPRTIGIVELGPRPG